MKKLIYVPIIHMSADLGSIAKQVDKRGIAGFGEEFWKRHRETISGFWDIIIKYFSNLEARDFKIYQDGLVADGKVGQKIVEEGIKGGSKNYEVINDLLKRGAILVQTENFNLVKEERDRIVKITQAKTITRKLMAYLKYRLAKNKLLKKRDNYIAKRIDETLNHGETGILFVGAYHNIIPKLSKDFQLTEVKEAKKVRDYQRLLLHYRKNEEEFEELAKYLISPVVC
ncbi:MAG: hypothetical protein SCARUB_01365 [Candidatus Scalindua rubra]|uniref:Uncharacterized protein n=1 Tax=Candidatus Scalindua rubra TaxID=1872076 RepID=A0A1E3XD29_9BACT|nr:MAG: hypothetical protein SCARUB_01365 [Candidatus Scalindua rubra]